jgi:hypothetical protein
LDPRLKYQSRIPIQHERSWLAKFLEARIQDLMVSWVRTLIIIFATAGVAILQVRRPEIPIIYFHTGLGFVIGFLSVGLPAHVWGLGCISFGYIIASAVPPILVWQSDKKQPFPQEQILLGIQTIGEKTGGWLILIPILVGWVVGAWFRRATFPGIQ